jgi:hypothetical protein
MAYDKFTAIANSGATKPIIPSMQKIQIHIAWIKSKFSDAALETDQHRFTRH